MSIPQQTDVTAEFAAQQGGRPEFAQWDQVQGQFGIETCRFFIDDFDLGVLRTTGAFLDPNSAVDEPSFVLPVKGLKWDAQRLLLDDTVVVPVTFAHPESYMSIWTMPGIFIRREAIDPDLQRYSQELEGFRIPAPQANILTIGDQTGPDEVWSRPRAEAYNFTYVIDLVARYRTDANALLRAVLPRFKQHRAILVRGSTGQLSEYTSFLQGVDPIDEILGVTLKHHGYSLTLEVQGELDLGEDDFRKTAQQIDLELSVKQPNITLREELGLAPIDTTPDGLPLKKQPADFLATICGHLNKNPLPGTY